MSVILVNKNIALQMSSEAKHVFKKRESWGFDFLKNHALWFPSSTSTRIQTTTASTRPFHILHLTLALAVTQAFGWFHILVRLFSSLAFTIFMFFRTSLCTCPFATTFGWLTFGNRLERCEAIEVAHCWLFLRICPFGFTWWWRFNRRRTTCLAKPFASRWSLGVQNMLSFGWCGDTFEGGRSLR